MTKIIRKEICSHEVEIPDGYVVCNSCGGKGLVSKYDEGWASMVHNAEMAALRPCHICGGSGFVAGQRHV